MRRRATPRAVSQWRRRVAAGRLQGRDNAYRSAPPRPVGDERVAEVVRVTLEQKPANATHWSTRSLARTPGLSQSTVSRIWADPHFVERTRDGVGLYLAPFERALVRCVDEKGQARSSALRQIQAAGRSRPLLPMRPGAA